MSSVVPMLSQLGGLNARALMSVAAKRSTPVQTTQEKSGERRSQTRAKSRRRPKMFAQADGEIQ
jgi:hypothetical protein